MQRSSSFIGALKLGMPCRNSTIGAPASVSRLTRSKALELNAKASGEGPRGTLPRLVRGRYRLVAA